MGKGGGGGGWSIRVDHPLQSSTTRARRNNDENRGHSTTLPRLCACGRPHSSASAVTALDAPSSVP